jgi:hypothetical protein
MYYSWKKYSHICENDSVSLKTRWCSVHWSYWFKSNPHISFLFYIFNHLNMKVDFFIFLNNLDSSLCYVRALNVSRSDFCFTLLPNFFENYGLTQTGVDCRYKVLLKVALFRSTPTHLRFVHSLSLVWFSHCCQCFER